MRVTLYSMIGKTAFLSCSHFVVRVMGFALRIWLSRSLGPQAMGLVELAQSAQMLLITPVVSGLPAAVTRMCAKADAPRRARILRLSVLLSLLASVPLYAGAFLLRGPLCTWLGDARTLPALCLYLPAIPILGVSCALNGYFYGCGKPMPPALSELLEQLVRLGLCMRLVRLFSLLPMPLLAAVPSLAAVAGEAAGLLLMLAAAARTLCSPGAGGRRETLGELFSLALPLTGMRAVSALMRTANAALIPARLVSSGLAASEAMTRFGMMQGMLLPVLMMPSFITGSLTMVVSPELTRRQACGLSLSRPVRRVLWTALAVGAAAMAAVYALAPTVASRLYRQAELLPLLRACCALVPVLSLCQVTGGMMNALGLQRASLRISLLSGLTCVLLVYALAAMPALRLWGAILATACQHLLTVALNLLCIRRALARCDQPRFSSERSASSDAL